MGIAPNETPTVTMEKIEANIKDTTFYYHGLMTICVLELQNGFTVTGESACAHPDRYNKEMGEKIASDNAKQKCWALMGYALKNDVNLLLGSSPKSKTWLKTYIGTKVLHAAPMSRGDYNKLQGWVIPENENPDDEGYLVEYADGGIPNNEKFMGYISWSPKRTFELAYREI